MGTTKQIETNLTRVKQAFEAGFELTVVMAIRLCQTSELRTYVSQLKKLGMDIKSKWVENNGKRFKKYWLATS